MGCLVGLSGTKECIKLKANVTANGCAFAIAEYARRGDRAAADTAWRHSFGVEIVNVVRCATKGVRILSKWYAAP